MNLGRATRFDIRAAIAYDGIGYQSAAVRLIQVYQEGGNMKRIVLLSFGLALWLGPLAVSVTAGLKWR